MTDYSSLKSEQRDQVLAKLDHTEKWAGPFLRFVAGQEVIDSPEGDFVKDTKDLVSSTKKKEFLRLRFNQVGVGKDMRHRYAAILRVAQRNQPHLYAYWLGIWLDGPKSRQRSLRPSHSVVASVRRPRSRNHAKGEGQDDPGGRTWIAINYPELKRTLLRESGPICPGCGIDFSPNLHNFQIDHIVPVSRGGSGDIENLQLLCYGCNRSKGAKSMAQWMKERS